MRYALAHPDSTIVHENLADISKVIANNAQIYQGGAQVLHMLRGVLGDDRFWAGIRLYYSRFRNGNASSDDFRHAMEDACSPTADCPDEAQDLVVVLPRVAQPRRRSHSSSGTWHYDAAAKQIVVTLDQTQTTGLYRMPMEIAVTTPAAPPVAPPASPAASATAAPPAGRRGGGGTPAGPTTSTVKMWIDKAHNTMAIPVAAEPTDVQLDPRTRVTMMQATFVKR